MESPSRSGVPRNARSKFWGFARWEPGEIHLILLENKKLFAYCISLPPGGRGTTQWGKEPALHGVLLCFMLRTLPQSRRAVPAPSRMEPDGVQLILLENKRFLANIISSSNLVGGDVLDATFCLQVLFATPHPSHRILLFNQLTLLAVRHLPPPGKAPLSAFHPLFTPAAARFVCKYVLLTTSSDSPHFNN